MRDKYIELIREYIRAKPEYKLTLNEIKADILTIGATEEEFDQAIQELSGLPNASKTFAEPKLKTKLTAKNHIFYKRKWIAAISLLVIIGVLIPFGLNSIVNKKETAVLNDQDTNLNLTTVGKIHIPSLPVVYANSVPIDAKKVFSVPYENIALAINGKPKKEVLGFFPYWMLLEQDKISLNTLSSISLFGLEADGKGNIVTYSEDGQLDGGWSMWKSPDLDTLIKKAKNKGINVHLTIKSFNDSNIESLSVSDDAQKAFIANVLYLINSKDLDGINIDFEYLGAPTDKVRDGFTRLITNLKIELKRQIPDALLSIDTYLVSASEKGLFDIVSLSNEIDYFVIMGYDMHTPLGKPGPVSAMGGDTNIIGYAQNYLEKTTPDKLILAVPYYGYDWPSSASDNPSREDAKTIPYAQIADASKNLQLSWDETSQTPFYNYKDYQIDRIVHFDNVRSLAIKYDFINRKNLKGVGIWALGYDGQNQDLEKLLIDKFINQ